MKTIRWLLGTIAIFVSVIVVICSPMPLMTKFILPLLFAGFLALFRIWLGPTAADRAVATDVLGILVIGVCAIMAIFTKRYWYMDIAIAWALQSFIGNLALAKYLEGRSFDD
jgi:multicomponent Na+:H+ antiporter subunit F